MENNRSILYIDISTISHYLLKYFEMIIHLYPYFYPCIIYTMHDTYTYIFINSDIWFICDNDSSESVIFLVFCALEH